MFGGWTVETQLATAAVRSELHQPHRDAWGERDSGFMDAGHDCQWWIVMANDGWLLLMHPYMYANVGSKPFEPPAVERLDGASWGMICNNGCIYQILVSEGSNVCDCQQTWETISSQSIDVVKLLKPVYNGSGCQKRWFFQIIFSHFETW